MVLFLLHQKWLTMKSETKCYYRNGSCSRRSNGLRFARKSALLAVFGLILLVGLTLSVEVGEGSLTNAQFTSTTEASVLQNGGFEEGLAGWEEVHGQGGSYSFSNSIVHSGSQSLVLGLHPPRPGSNPGAIVEGVSQTVSVFQLRGLKVEAWYQTVINTNAAAVRLVVQIGELNVRYYLFYGPQISSATTGDTQTLKSILLALSLCPSWCSTEVDLGSDFKDLFDPSRYADVFLSDSSVQVTVSLELLVYLTNDVQSIFWDDVGATAQVPAVQNATTTSTSLTSITASSTAFSSLSSTDTTATSTVQEKTTRVPGTEFPMNPNSLLLLGALVMVIVVLALDLTVRMRHGRIRQTKSPGVRKQVRCSKCEMSSPADANFCDACGTRFRDL